MKVKFHEVDEFLEELRMDRLYIEDRIVRLTAEYRPMPHNVHQLSILSSAVIRGKVVLLKRSCGTICNIDMESDRQAKNMAEEVASKIEKEVKDMGLEMRKGFFETT